MCLFVWRTTSRFVQSPHEIKVESWNVLVSLISLSNDGKTEIFFKLSNDCIIKQLYWENNGTNEVEVMKA